MLKLYPTPQSMQLKDGMYTFTAVSLAGDYPAKQVTDALAHYHITADSSAPANITYVKTEGMGNEAYILTVSETGVTITYSKDAGAMYAAQTLAQLIREKHVPCLSITDSPALENRMLSFDISRGKIPTMEHFKEIIDHLAAARYNTLILYWDSQVLRFAPFETYCVPDALTTAELDELKLYCNERNIKFSISVETFGHLANFLCYDEFKHLSNSLDPDHPNGDLSPLDPRSIEFVDMLIECVIPYCDTDFLQVHGDEIASLNTGKSKDAVAEKGVVAVYMEYMQKVCDLTWGKYHKIPIASSDMFIKAKHSDAENEAALDLFPKNAILDDWGYESEYEYHPFD
ncbi:MAG: hypothetical protein J6B85_03010 [Lachnospiraceae bacterium]|nr:hypothetical protein [Lachnospiraceae bacterium]